MGELVGMIERAPLSEPVKARAVAAFRLLAEAEGRVHGIAPDDVVLHEVGAHDALVDIVGGIEGFEQLGITDVYTRPVGLGDGWVRAAHGVLPVPAPATTLLLEGLAIGPKGPVTGEATTPTGAALLRVLAGAGEPPAGWRIASVGRGAGARDPSGYPNALTVILGEDGGAAADDLLVLATDLDDMSPEYLEALREALFAAGALDVQSWAAQMKKGRTGFRFEALVRPALAEPVSEAFFRHSSTAGVRRWRVQRTALAREGWELTSAGGRIRVKTLHGPDGPRVKPEYDDVVDAARRSGESAYELSRRIQEEALRQVRAEAAAPSGADNAHKESAR